MISLVIANNKKVWRKANDFLQVQLNNSPTHTYTNNNVNDFDQKKSA